MFIELKENVLKLIILITLLFFVIIVCNDIYQDHKKNQLEKQKYEQRYNPYVD